MSPPIKRCAIYTRKSTEEGLRQEFNSLDAQHEGCLAYIMSQKTEGWAAIKTHYDDGGYSGGNMNRPALMQLLQDIQAGKVDIVVVYKIDRLTRSLMDFSKLVEIFDKHNVTFVSITQSFNTTTSMGRLTLNVLLSFAQFEREVTGERIRDKVAASKKKGMWMGGYAPEGYNIVDKKLVVEPASAETVRQIFERYRKLRCVSGLKRDLVRDGIASRTWTSSTGLTHGGEEFSLGVLYKILRNPIYIGQVSHKGVLYDGQHEGIIDRQLWDDVQDLLVHNSPRMRGKKPEPIVELLRGKVFDPDGRPYSPSYTTTGGKRYRYYISQNLLHHRDLPKGVMARVAGPDLEDCVLSAVGRVLEAEQIIQIFAEGYADVAVSHLIDNKKDYDIRALMMTCLNRVIICESVLLIRLDTAALAKWFLDAHHLRLPVPIAPMHEMEAPLVAGRAKRDSRIVAAPERLGAKRDPFDKSEEELRRLAQGVIWRDEHFRGTTLAAIASRTNVSSAWVRRTIILTLESN